ncbi:MAG: EutP/PduV family microcompartment system protein [Candidatus Fimivivens sp.]|nr:EutP/PduV family microcompartment system protein [Candidatus Fimivivens sp.]
MMKIIMLIGRTSAGKTSFCQALQNEKLHYKKTQAIEIINNAIDTPGEYVENRAYYKALLVTSTDADCVILVQSCTDPQSSFAPGVCGMFNRHTIGLVTKIDAAQNPADVQSAHDWLVLAGCESIFHVSSLTGTGLEEVRNHLENMPLSQ